MANPHNGEVSIDIDGTTYTLALSMNAMVSLEEMFDCTFDEVTQKASKGSVKHTRALIWATLQKHHKGLTLEEAGDLINAGNIGRLNSKLTKMVSGSHPDPKDVKAIGVDKANPRKARVNGTGERSTSTPVGSV